MNQEKFNKLKEILIENWKNGEFTFDQLISLFNLINSLISALESGKKLIEHQERLLKP